MKTLKVIEKLNLIDEYNNGVRPSVLTKKYNISAPTVSRILRSEDKIRQMANGNQKRARKSDYPDVEAALLRWFNKIRGGNTVLNGTVLLEKAQEFAVQLNDTFDPSPSWVRRWCKRNSIRLSKKHVESNNSNKKVAQSFPKNYMTTIMKNYSPDCIFIADETTLYYKALPSGREENAAGWETQEQRLTLLLITNTMGSFKNLFCIGKPTKPSCFNRKHVPLPYFSNEDAWMTSEIWKTILTDLNQYFMQQNEIVCMIVHNAAYHKLNEELSNIKIEFLPPSTQPMNKGIISCFKVAYRKILITKQERNVKSVSLLDVITYAKEAWDSVTNKAIMNCFKNPDIKQSIIFDEDSDVEAENVINLNHELNMKSGLNSCDEILEGFESETEDEEEHFTLVSNPNRTTKEVLSSIAVVEAYCQAHGIDSTLSLQKIEELVLENDRKLKQKKITDFFKVY